MPKKAKPQPIDGLTFEQAFAEPEASVRALERSDLPLEESDIPFKVDLVDLRLAAPAFRRAAQTQGILLWKN